MSGEIHSVRAGTGRTAQPRVKSIGAEDITAGTGNQKKKKKTKKTGNKEERRRLGFLSNSKKMRSRQGNEQGKSGWGVHMGGKEKIKKI